ncbi:CPBP family intramembrane glutamic endopeptidase [Dactylosporangium sp. NPDC051484]|uniref:CPBP family intramembrane glutamic endopeptidase n=1 Tax=Dactylosporangium sp. NPDC051484 TaxID=3154942 RepID=UPI00344F93AE
MTTLLGRARTRYEVAPATVALAVYLVLAAVRISGAYNIPVMVLSMALTPLALLAVPRQLWVSVGICPSRTTPRLVAGTVIVVASYAVTVVASVAAFGDGQDDWLTWIPKLFGNLVPGPVPVRAAAMLLCLTLLVPLVEEVCYRGVLFDAAERRLGPFGAVVATAALWAAVHLGDYGLNPFFPSVIAGSLTSVFVMGLGLGICRLLTGSVLACVIAQGVGNLALYGWLLAQYGL